MFVCRYIRKNVIFLVDRLQLNDVRWMCERCDQFFLNVSSVGVCVGGRKEGCSTGSRTKDSFESRKEKEAVPQQQVVDPVEEALSGRQQQVVDPVEALLAVWACSLSPQETTVDLGES
eukprot:GHVS01036446.1.p1 GENE.GHVS01036446.1~~GHVS01036446.1.p1  ORF type:complete len:118 (+),score=21.20 GHVS01036446.1:53-406(+)